MDKLLAKDECTWISYYIIIDASYETFQNKLTSNFSNTRRYIILCADRKRYQKHYPCRTIRLYDLQVNVYW